MSPGNVPPPPTEAAKPKTGLRRRLTRLAVKVLICYLGVLIVLMALENSLLYHPTRASESWNSPGPLQVQDVELRSADGTALHAWWCPCPGSRGALLYCHGNAGNLSHRGGGVAELHKELGESVLIFDYPGYGRSQGKPSEKGFYAAAEAAYDWLTETQKVPAESVILYGKSLGGGVAVELATHRPHRALVLVRTFTSVPDMAQQLYPIFPARWLVRNRYDNLAKIGQCTRPVFIANGLNDSLIPFAQGERLFAAANEPKAFVAMRDGDHNDPFGREFYPELRQFLEKYAPLGEPGP